jgi:hypothetical protein
MASVKIEPFTLKPVIQVLMRFKRFILFCNYYMRALCTHSTNFPKILMYFGGLSVNSPNYHCILYVISSRDHYTELGYHVIVFVCNKKN